MYQYFKLTGSVCFDHQHLTELNTNKWPKLYKHQEVMNKNTIERKLELRINEIVNKIHLINFFLDFFFQLQMVKSE